MTRRSCAPLAASAVLWASLAAGAAVAQTPAPPSAPAPATSAADDRAAGRLAAGEPVVRRTVIEDSQARIEELRVRGTLQKVTVAPKGRAPGYEVLTGDGFHASAEDPGSSRGSAGKRVWIVLKF